MTKEDRRAAMPLSSAMWDAVLEHFGTPEFFIAKENGQEINYRGQDGKVMRSGQHRETR